MLKYDRIKAVEYAHKWAMGRNPAYYDFERLGGDCTNFASQCVFAGAGVANRNPNTGWFFENASNRAPAWTGVEQLHEFLVNNKGAGPVAVEVQAEDVLPGDICQLSFDGIRFSHSPVVVALLDDPNPDTILVAAHTFNCDNRALSSYTYNKARYLHIIGVNGLR